jgi:hypothetical protein
MEAVDRLAGVGIDLHVHTCLSPCAGLDMTPLKIVREALGKGLALIAVTDHNSAENAAAVMTAAERGGGPLVIPGMEITTSEEIHILGLFETLDGALSMQELVYAHLQPGENDEALFGIQVVASADDEVEGINTRLLIGATTLGLGTVVEAIHSRGGAAIAAHIDRASYSILGQLGFIPQDLRLDALEVSRKVPLREAVHRYGRHGHAPFLTASDAHDLESLGIVRTYVKIGPPGWQELMMAFKAVGGREVLEGDPGDGRPVASPFGCG